MAHRKGILTDVVTSVLTTSRRRCCLCFALRGDEGQKKGQIAHLDHDPSNNDSGNLAFMCLEHHDQYDTKPSQSKGFTLQEVKRYRAELLEFLAQGLSKPDPGPLRGTVHIALSELMAIVLTRLRRSFPLQKFRIVVEESVAEQSYLKEYAAISGIDREDNSTVYFGDYCIANVHLFLTWYFEAVEIGSGKKRFSYEEDFYGLLMDYLCRTFDSDIEFWSVSLRANAWIDSAQNTEIRCREGEFQISVDESSDAAEPGP
ncbi:MAG TPA: hypothetical protein VNX88_14205 [Terriglobales bacterium]|jgi:hypothetical protein|nr:hypothetical protein [Terriglobales bacterium]